MCLYLLQQRFPGNKAPVNREGARFQILVDDTAGQLKWSVDIKEKRSKVDTFTNINFR